MLLPTRVHTKFPADQPPPPVPGALCSGLSTWSSDSVKSTERRQPSPHQLSVPRLSSHLCPQPRPPHLHHLLRMGHLQQLQGGSGSVTPHIQTLATTSPICRPPLLSTFRAHCSLSLGSWLSKAIHSGSMDLGIPPPLYLQLATLSPGMRQPHHPGMSWPS